MDDAPAPDAAALERAERDRRIIEAYRSGKTMAAVAAEHGLSPERVRQLIRRADGRTATRRHRSTAEGERVRLRIGNLAKAVLVTGQAYQDPKDALNEFVSNAADDYAEAGQHGGRIRVMLRRKGVRAVIAVDDSGRGMSPDRLRAVARNLFESSKAGDDRTLGEKAIGLLAFQQLGARCDVVSRVEDSDETWTLKLRRGEAAADLARERRRPRTTAGTTVYISELDAEAARVLTQRKVVDYLRRRRGAAIAAGAYTIEVVEGRTGELVTPDEPDGLPLPLPAHETLWGRLELALYVAADADPRRRVAVVGRAGTTIIDDLAELDEFDRHPWTSGHVSGRVSFEPLRQSAGRRAVLRDDDVYPVFRDAVSSIEPVLVAAIERVRKEVDAATADRVLRGAAPGVRAGAQGARRPREPHAHPARRRARRGRDAGGHAGRRGCRDWRRGGRCRTRRQRIGTDARRTRTAPGRAAAAVRRGRGAAAADGRRKHLPSVAADPEPGHHRSRFDAESGTVLYNDQHADFLLVKDEESALLDYLATLVAKEYVVYNNPRAESGELAEELVRMLVRVRRHLPARTAVGDRSARPAQLFSSVANSAKTSA